MRLLGQDVTHLTKLGGGDLSQVFLARLADGTGVVVKTATGAGREAAMLRAIARAGVPCPEVLEATDGRIVMSALPDDGDAGAGGWAEAGTAVARLHAVHGAAYGWHEDHAFGAAAIPNAPMAEWPDFWAERRLCVSPETLPREISRRLDRLAPRLSDLLPARPVPSLLHGDLWSGNLLFAQGRFSGLIDPACHYGDAEVDLAMLALFGGLSAAFLDGYGAVEPGWEERRAVYQLWPALVHLRLFGPGYRGLVERLLDAALK